MRKWKLIYENGSYILHNDNGSDLPYNPSAGIQILEHDGYAFLDLNGNGRLDDFEDWRIDELKRYELLKLNLI